MRAFLALIALCAMMGSVHAAPAHKAKPKAAHQPHLSVNLTRPDHCLAQVVYEEARGESLVGQLHVAFVTKMRAVLSLPGFGGPTICGVAKAQGQYQGIRPGPWHPKEAASWQRALMVAHEVLAGRFVPEGEMRLATYYLNPAKADLKGRCWFARHLVPISVFGQHTFYREPLLGKETMVAPPECNRPAKKQDQVARR